jgi:hypothetical protein
MNPSPQVRGRKPGRFRVGDRVRITRGFPGAQAEILEDRGPIGVGGRHFYFVQIKMEGTEDISLDYAEEDMEPLQEKE